MLDLPGVIKFLLTFGICLFIIAPLSTLLHELGHALMALALTSSSVSIQLGQKGRMWIAKLGSRLTIRLFMEPGAIFGIYRLLPKPSLTRIQDIGITLGGPVTSLILLILFSGLGLTLGWADVWKLPAIINLIIVLNSGFPWSYPSWQGIHGGLPTDGLQLWRLIRQKPSPAKGQLG